MVRIRISYQDEKELERIVRILGNTVKKVKKSSNSEGKYKKAYVDIVEHLAEM